MLADKLQSRLKNGSGRIIWGFDPKYQEKNPFAKFRHIFEQIKDDLAGIKINRQLILPFGLQHQEIKDLVSKVKEENIPLIMDAKINDIGYTNESISRNYFEAGFDAVICNPFIGEKGLEPVLSTASDLHKDVILLVYMSHESADFGYGRKVFFSEHESQVLGKDNGYFYELFAYLTNKLPICGAIVGGNFPEKVKVIKNLLNKDKIIFSPGIGVQGGNPKQARIAGIDYAIIGRSITEEKNIQENIKKIKKDLE